MIKAKNASLNALLQLSIPPSESDWEEKARARQGQLTKPRGSLGKLEDLAIQLAVIQQNDRPMVDHAVALIFAADHPVARNGVSAFPVEVTAAMITNFLSGGAASSVLASSHQIPLSVIDVGVDTPYQAPAADPARYQIYLLPAGDLSREPALSTESFERAVQIGRQCVAERAHSLQLLILGEMGIGNTTSSSAVACALLGGKASDWVGRGTGVDDETMKLKSDLIQRGLQRWSHERAADGDKVIEAMQQLGGREMAAVLGAMIEAVQRGIAILVDGFIISVVALALIQLYPESRPYLIFSHQSQEQGHQKILAALGASPLLSLELRLGEASGALTAYPLLKAACALHNEMATFEEAAVPDRADAE